MILIIDFGSQTAHLIGRRLRGIGCVVSYAYPGDAIAAIKQNKPLGIILSGGPASVYEKGAPTISQKIFSLGIPVLGICYGWQLMAEKLGGKVKNTAKEYGPQEVRITRATSIFALPKKRFRAIVSHGDTVISLPQGFSAIAQTKRVPYTGVMDEKRKFFGVQFHPEADHTECGTELLKNFSVEICREKPNATVLDPQKFINAIQKTVGDKKVICAVSGGVDSTVATFLIGRAIGKNCIPVFVDSGLMRPDALGNVRYIFKTLLGTPVVFVNAEKQFLRGLCGVTDPEMKRKIIGKLYVDIFERQAKKFPDAAFLGQGTIYSDVIESKGTKHAAHIKSHHNVGGLPKNMHLKLLEPLRNLYKDEVRSLGTLAGLPDTIVTTQPWPGPGYAINIRGEVTKKRLDQVKQADNIVVEEMKKAKIYAHVFECWAVMTGAYSTAVKGDGRVFAEVVGIRSVDSRDVMTADWTRIPYNVLAKISTRIVNEVPDVSRVVYDITTKPPATMRWE